jgi:hypothetical protein
MNLFINILVSFLGAFGVLLWYALRKNGQDFILGYFLKSNQLRFALAGLLILVANLGAWLTPEFLEALRAFGIVIQGGVPTAIGLGVGGLVIAGIESKK